MFIAKKLGPIRRKRNIKISSKYSKSAHSFRYLKTCPEAKGK
jgi:hypothetical protein